MTIALTAGLLFVVYFIGYLVGRHDVITDIREMTKELEEKSHDANEMQELQILRNNIQEDISRNS